jgi:hypothetical protein
LILDQKLLTIAAPTGLLCAVASERRRAKMEGEKRERWMRLCVEVADEQDSNRLLELISEIDRLLHEKEFSPDPSLRTGLKVSTHLH